MDLEATCIPEEGFWGEEWGGNWSSGESPCLEPLMDLLPTGEPWTRDPCSWMGRVLNAGGFAICNAHDTLKEIGEVESNPATTTQCIDLWEEAMGLPEKCYAPKTLEERRKMIVAKLMFQGPPSEVVLKEVAAALGCNEVYFEYDGKGFYAGDPCNSYVMGPSWKHVWKVLYKSGIWNKGLECLFDKYKLIMVVYVYVPF